MVTGNSRGIAQDVTEYFVESDLTRLKRHQVLLVSQVMGGPSKYDGRDLRRAHAGLDICGEDFTAVVSYLAEALREACVPAEIIARVGGKLAATRPDVVAAGLR